MLYKTWNSCCFNFLVIYFTNLDNWSYNVKIASWIGGIHNLQVIYSSYWWSNFDNKSSIFKMRQVASNQIKTLSFEYFTNVIISTTWSVEVMHNIWSTHRHRSILKFYYFTFLFHIWMIWLCLAYNDSLYFSNLLSIREAIKVKIKQHSNLQN